MHAPANASLCRYIKDLARIYMNLATLQTGDGNLKGKGDPAVEQVPTLMSLRVRMDSRRVVLTRLQFHAGMGAGC